MLLNTRRPRLAYDVSWDPDAWVLSEEPAPESRSHDLVIETLRALLAAWIKRAHRNAQVGRNLAIRWSEEMPSVGADPDIYLVEPPPPEGDDVESLRLWCTGHFPPTLAIEVVSSSNAKKDYSVSPEKHAACGTKELWVFDPKLAGPRVYGGPVRLQIWTRDEDGVLERTYKGEGPAFSSVLGAYVFVVHEGRGLRIASDEEGTDWWMTEVEAERAAKEAALARIRELEAALARR